MFAIIFFHIIKTLLLVFYFIWAGFGNYAPYSDGGDFDAVPSFSSGDNTKYACITVTDTGVDAYQIGAQYPGYHYGPSMILNSDNSLDIWSATEATYGMWDIIRYVQTPDGGKTWTDETIAVRPTAGGEDAVSTCDPGAVKIGEYYYIGYTSTTDLRGTDNNVYVARSKCAKGPFDEKWTGSDWGTLPASVIEYTDNVDCFGIGEPSFVLMDDVLYIYYSYCGEAGATTRVATADATDPNWPATLVFHGECIPPKQNGGDSADVKYSDEYGHFIAVFTENRFTANSYIAVWESFDGFSFRPASIIKTDTMQCLHNCGISGRANGHIGISDPVYIGYGYGSDWAKWSMRLQPVELSLTDSANYDQLNGENIDMPLTPRKTRACSDVIGLFTRQKVFNIKKMRVITLRVLDSDGYTLPVIGCRFDGYDKSVVRRIGNLFFVVGDGSTRVTAHWYDFSYEFVINAGDEAQTDGD